MALVFRWYLGQSSRWANRGLADRAMDFQIWCGPAMAAFNDWARGSFLDDFRQRNAALVNLNLLYASCILLRAEMARLQGVQLPPGVPNPRPKTLQEIGLLLGQTDFSQITSGKPAMASA